MKCPKCSHNQAAIWGHTCGSCNYKFIFDPKSDPAKMTDGKFIAILNFASANDTYYFTKNQLYTAAVRTVSKKNSLGNFYLFLAILVGCWASGLETAPISVIVICLLTVISLFVLISIVTKTKVYRDDLDKLIRKWERFNGKIEKLIRKKSFNHPPSINKESDIYDYGVEGILIVEKDLYVDMLVLNNFHAEQRVLVVSQSGYPSYLAKKADDLLIEREDLPVYYLHDAIKGKTKFQGSLKRSCSLNIAQRDITDLGLNFENIKKIRFLKNVNGKKDKISIDTFTSKNLNSCISQSIITGTKLGLALSSALKGRTWSNDHFG